jgi:lipopolysaccharide biosynthesis glycosyltransferase
MINVIVCVDDELFEHKRWNNLKNSIDDNTEENVNFIVYHPDKDPIPEITEFNTSIVKSKAMFYRFLIPEIFPDIDRYIYLECDSILNDDIKELWDFDLDGQTIGLAADPFDFSISDTMRFQGKVPVDDMFMLYNIDIHTERNFLSGQMLVDAKKWRTHKYTQRLIDFVTKYKTADMIAINCVFGRDMKQLHSEWSAPARYLDKDQVMKVNGYIEKDYSDSSLYHFHGKPKPWESNIRYPMVKLWRKYD